MDYIIETKNLTKLYGNKKALDDVSIKLEKGDIYGLIGKNGAGKTTLLKLLLGLIRPSNGSISLFGTENLNIARRKIGSLIEAPGLYANMTAEQNLREFSILFKADQEEIPELLKLVGLENAKTKKVKAYSLGMKQRLGLALSLLGDPEILLLDEPVNGLDPEGIAQFRKIIEDIHKRNNCTIIISSHLIDELGKVATKYGIINNGKLVEEIAVNELENLCGTSLKVETNDNDKAVEFLKSIYPDKGVRLEGRYIRVDVSKNESSKLNKALVQKGFEVFASYEERNDPEKFFIERLK